MEGVGWIMAIIIGALAGWIAEKMMKANMGLVMNIILGIVGAVVGNFLLMLIFGATMGGIFWPAHRRDRGRVPADRDRPGHHRRPPPRRLDAIGCGHRSAAIERRGRCRVLPTPALPCLRSLKPASRSAISSRRATGESDDGGTAEAKSTESAHDDAERAPDRRLPRHRADRRIPREPDRRRRGPAALPRSSASSAPSSAAICSRRSRSSCRSRTRCSARSSPRRSAPIIVVIVARLIA